MSNIVTIKISANTADDLTGKAVSNAVRRAFGTLSDTLPESGEVKGLRFSVRQQTSTGKPKELSEAGVIRAWARDAGVPVGKRGRIHPDVKAAYAAAQAPQS
jgi:hypothetical protein